MRLLGLIGAACAVVLSGTASAATTIYTDEASFIAALSGPTSVEDFNDNAFAAPLLSIVSINGGMQGNHFRDTVNTSGAVTTFNFSKSMTAFGGFFNLSPGGSDQGIALLINGSTPIGSGVNFQIPHGSGMDDFWGFVSSIPFNSVTLVGGTQSGNQNEEAYHLDNLRFAAAPVGAAQAPPLPELSTWAMMILGFGFVGASMRRMRANRAARCKFA